MKTEQAGTESSGGEPRQSDQEHNARWKAIVFFVVGALMIAGVAFGISTMGHEDTDADGDVESTSPPGAEVQQYPPVPERVRTTGRYAIATTFGADPDADLPVSMVVPAGYRGVSGLAALQPGGETGVIIMAVGSVYTESCEWAGTELDTQSLSSADGLAAALARQEGVRVTVPTEVTVDGYPATYMERTVPAGTRLSDCDDGQFRVYADRQGGARWLTPGHVSFLWVVDVDGVPLLIEASGMDEGTSAKVRAEVIEMAESVQIDPA